MHLADIAQLNPKLNKSTVQEKSLASFVPMACVSEVSGSIISEEEREIEAVLKGFTYFQNGDILVAKITPCFENGKIALAHVKHEHGFGSTEFHVIRPDATKVDGRYLFHFLSQPRIRIEGEKRMTGSGGQRRVPKSFLGELEIPLPPLLEQRRIATILDKAEALRSKRREAIAKLDQLLQSVFLEMFEGSIEGNNAWKNASLSEYGSFKNGLNFEKGESGEKVRYLGVGDFKNRSRFENISNLAKIDLNALPGRDYFLKNGDLLFVRSNGNRELVGRCMEIYPEREIVTYSGFCIRYRIESDLLVPSYLAHLFRTNSLRNKLLQGGQGVNIQNINQKTLSNLLIPIPPIELQHKWNYFLKKIYMQKNKLLEGIEKQELFLISLQNNFFN